MATLQITIQEVIYQKGNSEQDIENYVFVGVWDYWEVLEVSWVSWEI